MRRVLDGDRVGTAHDRARNGQVGEQGDVVGEHGFAFLAEILEGGNRIVQVDRDALADVFANAALHEQQAGAGESRCDEEHGEQEAGAQPQARH